MKKLLLFALALSVIGCSDAPPQAPPPASPEAVGAAFQAWIAGWTGGDAEAVVTPLTEDAVVYAPSGNFTGREAIRSWAEETFRQMDSITISVMEASVRVTGSTGWITGAYEWSAVMDGEGFTDPGTLTMIWVLQEDGTYRSPHFHASADTEAAGAPDTAGGG